MALQKRLAQMSLGKQSAFGTPATTGLFKFGVQDGSAVRVDIDEADLDTTWTTRLVEGFERTQVRPGAEYGFVATRQLIGQHLFAALGSDVVTGTTPAYTHTVTEAEPLPYFTVFGRQDTDYIKVTDAMLDTLELSFELTSALKAKASWVGVDVTDSATPWTTSGADERVQSGYFTMGGGSFTIDGASANIQKGTITINNNQKVVAAAFQVEPVDHMPGILELTYSMTILPNDYGLWQKIIFGAAGLPASGVVSVPYYASIVQEWKSGATDTLTLTAPEVKVMMSFPAADVAGGPVEMEIEGKTAIDLSGSAITWALVNSTASY